MGISDTLSDAVAEIDEDLKEEPYVGELAYYVRRVRNEMDALRMYLDGGAPSFGDHLRAKGLLDG